MLTGAGRPDLPRRSSSVRRNRQQHEDAGFNGGFTVAQYGSNQSNGIDAVQFEFGVKHLRKGEVEASAKRAARAVAAFYEVYLKGL